MRWLRTPFVAFLALMSTLVAACTQYEQIPPDVDPLFRVSATFPITVNDHRIVQRIGYRMIDVTKPLTIAMNFEVGTDTLQASCGGKAVERPELQVDLPTTVGTFPLLSVPLVSEAHLFKGEITDQTALSNLCPLHVGNLARPALVSATWQCGGGKKRKQRPLVALHCTQELPILGDPRGSIGRPSSTGCDWSAHDTDVNVKPLELFRVFDSAGTTPLSSSNGMCGRKGPWNWTLNIAPPLVTLVSVPQNGSPGSPPMVPPFNPDGIGPKAPSSGFPPNPTYTPGQYWFNAPVDGCYVVKYTTPGGCVYYSPIVAESSTLMVTDLDLYVDLGSLPNCPLPAAICR